ncbi:GntR family transcriptional regulator [Streptomyces sp. NPDC017230]|uniref:GntR family transcriptional regulator n=1 Tax=unclassified Streptomyces TaxID=2593676 RepID=UPI00378898A9
MTPPTTRKGTSRSDGGAAPTPLTRRTAARIVEHIVAEGLAVGTRLVERVLADQLKVSRSPVRQALRLLAGGRRGPGRTRRLHRRRLRAGPHRGGSGPADRGPHHRAAGIP